MARRLFLGIAAAAAAGLALAAAGGDSASNPGDPAPPPRWDRLAPLAAADRPVTVVGRDLRLDDVMRTLARDAGCELRLEGELPTARGLSFVREPLGDVLSRLAGAYGLDYDVPDPGTLVVRALPLAGVGDVSSPRIVPASHVNPAYPPDARDAHVEGRVFLQVLVRADGTVDAVEVVHTAAPAYERAFARSAVEAVRQWRYEPALRDGRPVDVWLGVPIDFELH